MKYKKIINAGIEYTLKTRPVCIASDTFADAVKEFNRNLAFEAGAKWIIEKTCEWLKENAYFSVNDLTGSLDEQNLVDRFRKAMEE